MTPKLIVTVDVEEIFDWDEFDRNSIAVPRTSEIRRFQRICDEFALRPLYFITYPMLNNKELTDELQAYQQEGLCELGIHIHTWTTPPYLDQYDRSTSFQGNLSRELEEAKIGNTLDKFNQVFKFDAPLHRAGRFGCGKNTFGIINQFGLKFDFSPSAKFDFSKIGGPNYSDLDSHPFADSNTGTICFPVTGEHFYQGPDLATPFIHHLRLSKTASRFLGTQVVRLTTEDNSANRLKVLTRLALAKGLETFVYTAHTTTFFKNGNRYAASDKHVENFFLQTRNYFDFFVHRLDGVNGDPSDINGSGLKTLTISDCF